MFLVHEYLSESYEKIFSTMFFEKIYHLYYIFFRVQSCSEWYNLLRPSPSMSQEIVDVKNISLCKMCPISKCYHLMTQYIWFSHDLERESVPIFGFIFIWEYSSRYLDLEIHTTDSIWQEKKYGIFSKNIIFYSSIFSCDFPDFTLHFYEPICIQEIKIQVCWESRKFMEIHTCCSSLKCKTRRYLLVSINIDQYTIHDFLMFDSIEHILGGKQVASYREFLSYRFLIYGNTYPNQY